MRNKIRILFLLCALLIPASSAFSADVLVLTVTGTIDPAVSRYVLRGIEQAERKKMECVVIEIDTPGGLMDSMKSIATGIINAKVPVAVYVYPSGSTATSAGFFILMASDIAAMAPSTSTGSAHPVQMEGKMDKTMKEKVTNYAVAYMESLAKRQKRNVEWAKKAVTRSVSITETDAMKEGVIEIIADSPEDLLKKIDGIKLVKKKKKIVLHTRGTAIIREQMTMRERFLHIIAHPNIAYILFIVGVYGIIFEVTHPGVIVPGVVGAVSLILAFTAFQVIPINTAGLVLLIGAAILFILEVKIVSHGLLTLGGTTLMILGSLLLVDSTDPSYRISLQVIITTALMTAIFFGIVLAAVIRTHRRQVTTGTQGMIGMTGKATTNLAPEGKVLIHGELWNAAADGTTIEAGKKVVVVSMDGMELVVKEKM
ncbi:MAG: nodulation protein NfeD [bacterium]